MRKEVWKFLLELYPSNCTAMERAEMANARREDYLVLSRQWSTITPKQVI
jgi:hypothetical protein